MDNNFHRNRIKENDTIKEIISKYDDILNNKSIINEEFNLVKLSSTNYSNLKYDLDGTKNDDVNKPLLDDLNSAAKSAGLVATITTAKTGHSEKVKGGKSTSRHMNGTGVDIAILDNLGSGKASNATNGNAQFRDLGFKLKDALVSMGYKWNTESGNDKAVLWQTNTGGNHYNHLHVSNRSNVSSSSSTSSPSSKKELPNDIVSAISKLKSKYGINITKIEIDKEFKQEGNWVSDNKSVDKTAETKINELIKDCKKKFPKISTGIISGYRSYDDQVDNFGSKAKSRGIEDTQKSNTLPGFSQHHTGKAFDIFSVDTSWWNSNKDVKKWVEDNAKKYGFKVTYTELGKLRIPEPWHLYYDNNKSTTTTDNTTTDNTTTGDSKDKLDLLGNETGDNKINDLLGFLNYFKPGAVSEDLINKKNKIHEDVVRIKDIMKKIL